VYTRLDYSNVNSCDSATGEILTYLEQLREDEVLEVVLDADWKVKELERFISKTKYKVLKVEEANGRYVVTLGGGK
jgi:TusA-related sulfurtransferase